MKKIAIVAALLLASPVVAFAKGKGGGGTPQTHHCMLNGAEVQKTKKECVKDGGKWEKGAPAAAAGGAAAPAPAPAPTPAK